MYHGPEHYLDNDDSASRIMGHARLLLKLSRRLESIAPGGLRHAARVANFKSGRVVIHADNGAVAAKIRQMSERLCVELSKGGIECNALEVKVQPKQSAYQTMTSTQKPLSGTALRTLGDFSSRLPAGPLRDALDGLLRRSAKKE